ncbi:uncharacterized protein PSFLO_05317 [Pseudozyma flocculosa]|uniref:Uncharacterized protein n=1 Tax=Pseudozyma flocculosa TaxID=84751 RepID=A0A5C3F6Z9_9BASI|nr:uncharacterized protein PSFLO_05317 [Pseudozyma flocculosa]
MGRSTCLPSEGSGGAVFDADDDDSHARSLPRSQVHLALAEGTPVYTIKGRAPEKHNQRHEAPHNATIWAPSLPFGPGPDLLRSTGMCNERRARTVLGRSGGRGGLASWEPEPSARVATVRVRWTDRSDDSTRPTYLLPSTRRQRPAQASMAINHVQHADDGQAELA